MIKTVLWKLFSLILYSPGNSAFLHFSLGLQCTRGDVCKGQPPSASVTAEKYRLQSLRQAELHIMEHWTEAWEEIHTSEKLDIWIIGTISKALDSAQRKAGVAATSVCLKERCALEPWSSSRPSSSGCVPLWISLGPAQSLMPLIQKVWFFFPKSH